MFLGIHQRPPDFISQQTTSGALYGAIVADAAEFCRIIYRVRKWKVNWTSTFNPEEGSPVIETGEFFLEACDYDEDGFELVPLDNSIQTRFFPIDTNSLAQGGGVRHFDVVEIPPDNGYVVIGRTCYFRDGGDFYIYIWGSCGAINIGADFSGTPGWTVEDACIVTVGDAVYEIQCSFPDDYSDVEVTVEAVEFWDHAEYYGSARFSTTDGSQIASPFA